MRSVAKKAGADMRHSQKVEDNYRKLERSEVLSDFQMLDWMCTNLDVCTQAGITVRDIISHTRDVKLPRDSIQFLMRALESGARVGFISSGVSKVIELTLDQNGISTNEFPNLEIHATELIIREEKIIGYDRESIVLGPKKGQVLKEMVTTYGINQKDICVVGDGLTDKPMFLEAGPQSQRILLASKKKQKNSNFMDKLRPHISHVVYNFKEVEKIINE